MVDLILARLPRYTLLTKEGLDRDIFKLLESRLDWELIIDIRRKFTGILVNAHEPRGIDFD
jgi:hypothetical protein